MKGSTCETQRQSVLVAEKGVGLPSATAKKAQLSLVQHHLRLYQQTISISHDYPREPRTSHQPTEHPLRRPPPWLLRYDRFSIRLRVRSCHCALLACSQRITSTRRYAAMDRLLTCEHYSAKGTLLHDVACASERLTDNLHSKTFLARLCEQAERYDGTSWYCGMESETVANLKRRDGRLHEGMLGEARICGD